MAMDDQSTKGKIMSAWEEFEFWTDAEADYDANEFPSYEEWADTQADYVFDRY